VTRLLGEEPGIVVALSSVMVRHARKSRRDARMVAMPVATGDIPLM